MNSKALYKQILENVAKRVEQILNENLDRVPRTKILELIDNTDWQQEIRNHSYNYNITKLGGNIYFDIPNTSDLILDFDVEYTWRDSSLRYFKIKKITIYNDDIPIMDMPELREFVHFEFQALIEKLAKETQKEISDYEIFDFNYVEN